MRIILGQELGGTVYRDMQGNCAEAGTLIAGTARFLEVVEIACGFPEADAAPLRVFQYERALADVDDGRSFYSASFRMDSLGVAQTLLEARDEILLSAPSDFEFTALEGIGERLSLFARAERRFRELGPAPGVPDRIRRVLAELRSRPLASGIDEVLLVDEEESWHPLFRELIAELRRGGSRVVRWEPVFPEAAGDLSRVRKALVSESLEEDPPPPAVDGSFLLFRGPSPAEAADFTAALIDSLSDSGERVLIINDGFSTHLDEACIRAGLPVPGGEFQTAGLPVFQALPLALQLSFAPVELPLLAEYLSLPSPPEFPASPVPWLLRKRLLSIVTDMPGFGGGRWRRTVELFLENTAEENRARMRETLGLWLDLPAASGRGVLPAERVFRLCDSFKRWTSAQMRAGSSERNELYRRAALQADLIRSVVELRGERELSRHALRKLLADVSHIFRLKRKSRAEAGAPVTVASPAAVLSAADTIIYWNFSERSLPVPSRRIFSGSERRALTGAGVRLLPPEAIVERHLAAVTRVSSFAGKRLYLVCAEAAGGEPVNPHPLWYRMIRAFAEDADPQKRLCLSSVSWLARETWFDGGNIPLGKPPEAVVSGSALKARFEAVTELPGPVELRAVESPSAIEKLVGCPLAYVLSYTAALRPVTRELPAGGLLYGKVAHDVIETYLASDPGLEHSDSAGAALREIAADRIREEAAVLFQEGMDTEREFVIRRIAEAGAVLASALHDGGFRIVGIEEEIERPYGDIRLKGKADLIVERTDGAFRAIIDLKWSNENGYRDLLGDGRALQVASYSFLLDRALAPAAYFIIRSGRFLSVHRDLFPGTSFVAGMQEYAAWQRLDSYLSAQVGELAAQRVAVGLPESAWKSAKKQASAEEELPFVVAAPCRFCDFGLFCGIGQDDDEGAGEGR